MSTKTTERAATAVDKPKRITVPAGLFFQMTDALRAANGSSGRETGVRVLDDDALGKVSGACDALTAWQDERVRGGR